MNTKQKTVMFESTSECFLDSDMAHLLEMTNEVLLKIKLQTKEKYQ
ncbi:MAG: hypothetical protein K5777_06405 [Nitrosopumilus sp.]|nr:hypothetical protein [Nitrosopumilus sp.]